MSTPNPATTEWVPLWGTTSGPAGGAGGPHHATHEPGGTDELVALSAAILTSGALPFARVPVSAASKLLGRGASGAGAMEELTLGTNLTMSGTTLNATGGLVAHQATHRQGGSDPVDVKLLAGYPGDGSLYLTGLGTFAAVPSLVAHKTTHEPGGTDALTALNASILTSGTLPDARLSTNVAMRNVGNTFAGQVQATTFYSSSGGTSLADVTVRGGTNFQGGLYASAGGLSVVGNVQSGLYVYPGAVNNSGVIQGSWYLGSHSSYGLYSNTGLYLESALWASSGSFRGTVSVSGDLTLGSALWANSGNFQGAVSVSGDVTGANLRGISGVYAGLDIYEKGRSTPVGHWISVPFNAGNFTGSPATWTVDAGDVLFNWYTIIGKTMIWSLNLADTSVSGTATNYLYVVIPGGFTGTVTAVFLALAADNGILQTGCFTTTYSNTHVGFFNPNKTWSNSTHNTDLRCTMIIALT